MNILLRKFYRLKKLWTKPITVRPPQQKKRPKKTVLKLWFKDAGSRTTNEQPDYVIKYYGTKITKKFLRAMHVRKTFFHVKYKTGGCLVVDTKEIVTYSIMKES